VRYPPIADLAQPMLRLAGVRIVPKSRTLHNPTYWSEFTLTTIPDGAQTHVTTPAGAKLGQPRWSADGKRFAFAIFGAEAMELWIAETGSGKAHRVPQVRLNPILGDELQWMPDQKTLLVKLVPKGQPPPPEQLVPKGPDIQEATGEKGASSTYELRDVLKSPRDEALFEYYASSSLALVDAASGRVTTLGKPALYSDVAPAPDG
jgi:dipeptidyl aminopeptidase/acylaminoacyl peptidase